MIAIAMCDRHELAHELGEDCPSCAAEAPAPSLELAKLRAENERLTGERDEAVGALARRTAAWVAMGIERDRLKLLIERDKTGLASALDEVRKIALGYDWICEGRGPYVYDDDRYRMEVGNLITLVVDTAGEALRKSGGRVREAFMPRARLTAAALNEECPSDPEPTP